MTDILHYYLDLLRNENEDSFGFHNVLNVMKQSRGGYVLNESFDGIDLRNEPLVGIHFSDEDGQNASSFRGCKVSRNCFLSGHSAPIESMEFIDDNTLVSRSANEVITWDIWSGVPIDLRNHLRVVGDVETEYFTITENEIDNIEEIRNPRYLKKLLDGRLLLCFSTYEIYKVFIYDMKTKKGNTFFVADAKNVLKVKSYYVLYDLKKKELLAYDFSSDDPKWFSLNISFEEDNISLRNDVNNKYIYADSYMDDLVSCNTENCYIINTDNWSVVAKIKVPPGTFAVFIPQLNCALSISTEKPVFILTDISNYNVITEFLEMDKIQFKSVAVLETKDKLAISDVNNGIEIYSVKTGVLLKVLGGLSANFLGTVSNDRKYAIISPDIISTQPKYLWNIKDNRFIEYLYREPLSLHEEIFSPLGEKLMLYRDRNQSATLIDIENLQMTAFFYVPDDRPVQEEIFFTFNSEGCSIAWDPSENYIFFLYNSFQLYIFNKKGEFIQHIDMNFQDAVNILYSVCEDEFDLKCPLNMCISDQAKQVAYYNVFEKIVTLDLITKHKVEYVCHCICPISVSDDVFVL